MLPDYGKAKAELHDLLMRYLRNRVRALLGPFSEIPQSQIFEGHRSATRTDDGRVLESQISEHSAKFSISREDIQSCNPRLVFDKLETLAHQMAESQTRAIFGQLGKTCEETGQTVDFKGQRFGPEAIMEGLKKISIEFDRDGKMHQTCIIPPQLAERGKETIDELQSDPELKRRFDELIERKRMEWRDREASRKLVG